MGFTKKQFNLRLYKNHKILGVSDDEINLLIPERHREEFWKHINNYNKYDIVFFMKLTVKIFFIILFLIVAYFMMFIDILDNL